MFTDSKSVFVELIVQLLKRIKNHALSLSERIERFEEQSEDKLVRSLSIGLS